MTERAYCRVYYSIQDDPKFEGIREDDHHLATWLRLLMVADAIWPASANLPAAARRASLKALVAAELVDLLPGGRYRIHGLDAERGARREAAQTSRAQRTSYGRSTNVERGAQRSYYSHSEPSQAETETKPSQPPARRNGMEPIGDILPDLTLTGPPEDAYGVSEDEVRVFAFLAKVGAAIRPDSGFGRRILGLIERRGVEDVLRQAGLMSRGERLSDRQWVFGLEEALEAVPNGRDAQKAERAEDERRLREKRLAATAEQTADLRAMLAAKEGTS
jgi:hypothetical protein